jgi:two-component system, response regulator YesN
MRTVLIVDDERIALEGLSRGVDWVRLGVNEIHTAESLREARKVFETAQPDVMICDIEMPNGSGLDLAAWVRERHPEVDTVFLTCHADFSYAQRALKLGSFDYLLKPAPYRDIETVLDRLFEKRESAVGVRIDPSSADFGTEEAGDPCLPDMALWSILLLSGGVFAVRAEALAFLETLGRSGTPNLRAMHRFRQDFMQAAYSFFRTKRIPVHEVFGDQESLRLETRALSGIPALSAWVAHVLDRLEEGSGVDGAEMSEIGRATRFIARHITDDLSCVRVAEEVSLHPDTLTRIFKKEIGCTVSEFILQEKMRLACSLLEHTDLPIGAIATRLGYVNFSHFSEAFKKRETMSPAKYRAERRNPGNASSPPG